MARSKSFSVAWVFSSLRKISVEAHQTITVRATLFFFLKLRMSSRSCSARSNLFFAFLTCVESYLHPAATRGAERDPRQARNENVVHPRSARGNAAGVPATPLPAPIADRKPVQFGEAQAFGSCAGPLAAYAEASSSAARLEFQSVPLEASLPFLENVNRASRSPPVRRRFYETSRPPSTCCIGP